MQAVLDKETCKSEYLKTLDHMSNIALFQYTLNITIFSIYLALSSGAMPEETYSLLGLTLPAFTWLLWINIALTIVFSYLIRMSRYLKSLFSMHSELRKELAFLTWNHYWLFNPFRSSLFTEPERRTLQAKSQKLNTPEKPWHEIETISKRVPHFALSFYLPVTLFSCSVPVIPFIGDTIVKYQGAYESLSGFSLWTTVAFTNIVVALPTVMSMIFYNLVTKHRQRLWEDHGE